MPATHRTAHKRRPSRFPLLPLAVLACALPCALLAGCAGTFGEGTQTVYCRRVDDQRVTWGAVAKSSAALSGASGLAVIPMQTDGGQLGVAAGAVALGALSVAAVYVAEAKGETWARECSEGGGK